MAHPFVEFPGLHFVTDSRAMAVEAAGGASVAVDTLLAQRTDVNLLHEVYFPSLYDFFACDTDVLHFMGTCASAKECVLSLCGTVGVLSLGEQGVHGLFRFQSPCQVAMICRMWAKLIFHGVAAISAPGDIVQCIAAIERVCLPAPPTGAGDETPEIGQPGFTGYVPRRPTFNGYVPRRSKYVLSFREHSANALYPRRLRAFVPLLQVFIEIRYANHGVCAFFAKPDPSIDESLAPVDFAAFNAVGVPYAAVAVSTACSCAAIHVGLGKAYHTLLERHTLDAIARRPVFVVALWFRMQRGSSAQ